MNKVFGLSDLERTKETIFSWYYRGQLNYVDLFISYIYWFKKATGKNRDRDAVNALKERPVVWEEYQKGETLFGLKSKVREIAKITQGTPLENLTGGNQNWNGVVADENDWQSLIEFWYRVRCNLFHGAKSPEDYRDQEVVRLAYESLNIFMSEIVRRMKSNFSRRDLETMSGLLDMAELLSYKLAKLEHGSDEWQATYERYQDTQSQYSQLHGALQEAFDLWNVDMEASYGR